MAKKASKKARTPTAETHPINEVNDNLPVPIQPSQKGLVLEGDPDAQLAFAAKAANALMSIVANKPNPVIIQGKQYLEYGDWQVLARFYGATVEIEWTHPLYESETSQKIVGYEARALVKRNGEVISSAEGMCMRDEKRWKTADEYAVRSMAQTRTAAKALRNAFGWVAELAGYSATPAEEMPRDTERMPSYQTPRRVPAADDEAGGAVIQMDEPPFETPQEQREKIFKLLKMLGVDPTDKKMAEGYIGDELELALVESNFEKIIKGLETRVKNKK